MKSKEWWIYQKREVESPWAIHMYVQKHYRSIRADTELFADWIPAESKRLVLGNMSIVRPEHWMEVISTVLTTLDHPPDDQDLKQLAIEIDELKLSFKW